MLLFLYLRDEPVARRSAMRAGLELTELGISWKFRGFQGQHCTHVMSTSVTFRHVCEEKLILTINETSVPSYKS